MLAREYNKRIDIQQIVSTPDGFGGNTVSFVTIGSSWAKLVNNSISITQRATVLGISDLYEPLMFKIRFRNDLNYNGRNLALIYAGQQYIIKSIINIDMFNRELEILCTKENPIDIPLNPVTT